MATETLKLPEKVRVRLLELHRARVQAERDFQGPMATAYTFSRFS